MAENLVSCLFAAVSAQISAESNASINVKFEGNYSGFIAMKTFIG